MQFGVSVAPWCILGGSLVHPWCLLGASPVPPRTYRLGPRVRFDPLSPQLERPKVRFGPKSPQLEQTLGQLEATWDQL